MVIKDSVIIAVIVFIIVEDAVTIIIVVMVIKDSVIIIVIVLSIGHAIAVRVHVISSTWWHVVHAIPVGGGEGRYGQQGEEDEGALHGAGEVGHWWPVWKHP